MAEGSGTSDKLPPCSNNEISDGLRAGYLAYLGLVQYGLIKPRKAGRPGRKVETKKKEMDSDEWLKGTYYNQVRFYPPSLRILDWRCLAEPVLHLCVGKVGTDIAFGLLVSITSRRSGLRTGRLTVVC